MTDREQHSEMIIQDYLDDRLSAVDRQQVEEQLATDPQGQQELEELRMIGSALRELPAHQLGDDFVDEVMVGLAENRNPADPPSARVVTSRYSPGRLQRLPDARPSQRADPRRRQLAAILAQPLRTIRGAAGHRRSSGKQLRPTAGYDRLPPAHRRRPRRRPRRIQ